MDERHERGSYRWSLAAGSTLVTGVLLASVGIAHAEPTPDEVREEIESLEREFSELNEEYNQAKEDYDAAQEKLEDVESDLEDTEEQIADLRDTVSAIAGATYTGVDYSSPAFLVGAGGPEEALHQAADLGYLSQNQEDSFERYADEMSKLEDLSDEAEEIEESAKEDLDKAKEARDKGEAKIEEQQELLDELTAEQQEEVSSDTDSSGGASYTGSASGDARTALDFAYAQIGKPYVWGGTGPDGFDCSGLTQAAWGKAGVSLPRVSQDQFHAGSRVSWDQLQPGDLMFFYGSSPSHVGMYAGNGKMVHASTSSKPIHEVALSDYYRGEFVGGVRP